MCVYIYIDTVYVYVYIYISIYIRMYIIHMSMYIKTNIDMGTSNNRVPEGYQQKWKKKVCTYS